ncbi:MAG: amidohydrolase family protein, partial [Verrucomicrobiota bacterium]|nr:amidohydrolase family protein [Verrucomicrobiota bacterium]
MRLLQLVLLPLIFGAAQLHGQSPTPAATSSADTVIHAGTLLDRPGKEPRRNVSILVKDGKIAAVQDGFVQPAAGGAVIDLRDRFVLPGLIDCHVHLDSDRAGMEGQLASVT